MNQEAIILLHGLFMTPQVMKRLEKSLLLKGYDVYHFSYPTVRFSKEEVLKKLDALVQSLDYKKIFFVGHSMGGLVARLYFTDYEPQLNDTAVITLGTPHQGSTIGKYLKQTSLGFILGTCGQAGIIEPIPQWEGKIPLGSIMGISNYGVNTLLKKFHGKQSINDGTVFLEESVLENATDHAMVKSTHFTLLFNPEVITQIDCFIKERHFLRNNYTDLLSEYLV